MHLEKGAAPVIDPSTQAVIDGLQRRCAAAIGAFERLNKEALQHNLQYNPSPFTSISAMMDALVEQLTERGLLDYGQFVVAAMTKQAEVLESNLVDGAGQFREATGIIVPLGFSSRPQG